MWVEITWAVWCITIRHIYLGNILYSKKRAIIVCCIYSGIPAICTEGSDIDTVIALDDIGNAVPCRCPCGSCDFSHILHPPPDCLVNRHSDSRNFPEVDLKSSKYDKKQLNMELKEQTQSVEKEFMAFIVAVRMYAKSIPDIESLIKDALDLTEHEQSSFEKLYRQFREGANFINYDILLHRLSILKLSGTENELRRSAEAAAERYEASFKEYAQHRVVLVPTILQDANGSTYSVHKKLKIKVEEEYLKFRIDRLYHFKKVVKTILKLPPHINLRVTSVREGCVEICFEMISLRADEEFDPTLDNVQKQELLANNIILLEYDGQVPYCCCELLSDEVQCIQLRE